MLILYMYSLKSYLLMSYSNQVYIVTQVYKTDLYFVYQQNLLPKGMLCNAVACPHLERSGMSTACSRSASAHLYHTDGRLTSCDGAVTDCI